MIKQKYALLRKFQEQEFHIGRFKVDLYKIKETKDWLPQKQGKQN